MELDAISAHGDDPCDPLAPRAPLASADLFDMSIPQIALEAAARNGRGMRMAPVVARRLLGVAKSDSVAEVVVVVRCNPLVSRQT